MSEPADLDVERRRFIIIGAGPAGLQLSYYLQRAGADYLTLERGDGPGGFFRAVPAPPPADLPQQGAHHQRRPGDPAALGLELAAQRPADAAVPRVQQRVLPARRRPGALPGRLRSDARPRRALRHARSSGSSATATASSCAPARATCAAGASSSRPAGAQPYVPPIRGIEHADRLRGHGRRPARLRRPAGAHHRQGQLRVRDRGLDARPRRDGPPGQPPAAAAGLEHQAPRRRARPSRRGAGQLPVQDAALGARLHHRRDPAGRRTGSRCTSPTPTPTARRAVLEYESVLRCTGFRDGHLRLRRRPAAASWSATADARLPARLAVDQRGRSVLRRHPRPGPGLQDGRRRRSSTASGTTCARSPRCCASATRAYRCPYDEVPADPGRA